MKKSEFIFIFLLLSAPSHAEPESTPATAAPPAPAANPQAIVYELRNLKPAGITQYSTSSDSILRQYFEFKNEQGSHNIIYEELSGNPPLRTVTSLREISRDFESNCAIDIECSTKAFCTGDCKNMYYEVANAPGDTYAPERNKCRVQYFSCEKAGAPGSH